MNINIQTIKANNEVCTVCGRPATTGRYISGEIEDDTIDFGVFFCDDHRHLADRTHIEEFVIDVMEV